MPRNPFPSPLTEPADTGGSADGSKLVFLLVLYPLVVGIVFRQLVFPGYWAC